uniref:Uncharacterized protein n=1 Tax=Arundo donax TaxID=35708 RepID=A0A0A9A3J0_ARUDO
MGFRSWPKKKIWQKEKSRIILIGLGF